MLFTAQPLPYRSTHKFSKIVTDYIDAAPALQPFYAAPPTTEGLLQAIAAKAQHTIDRQTLVTVLQQQYAGVTLTEATHHNIQSLLSPTTFTVCTAHQPNLFTGPLYFIYKILHAVQLATFLKAQAPQYNFVPVYYMGSEDADLEELNHTYVGGKKYVWDTEQTGAVGRMHIDKKLLLLFDEMSGQLSVQPFGAEVINLLRQCYAIGKNIQTATFEIVHSLFGKYGLLVLIPDHGLLKKCMLPVFEEDLFSNIPADTVSATASRLSEHYNVQAHPREINLFYLKDNLRNRIVKENDVFKVLHTDIVFTADEIKQELVQHPERFSPNVILRGLFQETILPNVAFIGGGGELAYWLQLKDLFQHYRVPFPTLVLRNSFLIIEKRWQKIITQLQLQTEDIFIKQLDLINLLLEREHKKPQLNGQLAKLEAVYEDLKKLAMHVDVTLAPHVAALHAKALKQVQALEKKMQRAERKKHTAMQRQIATLQQYLFPNNGLQERAENFSSFYAQWGATFIDALLQESPSIEQQFVVLYTT